MSLNQLVVGYHSSGCNGNGCITAAELAWSLAKAGHPLSFDQLYKLMMYVSH